MRKIAVVSTTHIDRHNTRITKEALEKAANQINNGKKPAITIEHDITLPPVGQIVRAWVEPTEDGEHKLFTEQDYFEKEGPITLPDGSSGAIRESDTTHYAFVDKEGDIPEQIILKADPVNFTSFKRYEDFLDDVRTASPISFEHGEIGRKAHIPDPEVIITIGKGVLAYLAAKGMIDKFGSKIADKLSDKVSEDIVDFYIWVKSVAVKAADYIVPKNRPITYVFSFPIQPHTELIARTSDPDEVAASIMEDNLEKPLKQVVEFREKLGATRVQFLLNEKGEWKFNYLLTNKGQVIGTELSFSRKARQIDLPIPASMPSIETKQPIRFKKNKHRRIQH